MTKRMLLVLASATLLSGCAGLNGPAHDKIKPVDPVANTVDAELIAGSNRTNRLLSDMVSTEAARRGLKETARGQPSGVLASDVTMSWHSPVDGILRQIANLIGYRFVIFGKPALPVIVSIEARNTPLMDVLENIGVQAGSRADVVFNEREKTIELRYVQTGL